MSRLRAARFLLSSLLSFAAATAPAASREEDLAALRSRIGALSSELASQEDARREAREALRASERAISEASRSLAALEAEARRARDESRRLAEQSATLERSLADRREALGRLLAARSMAGSPDLVRVLLSGADASDLARRIHYLEQVSIASARAIADFQKTLRDLGALRREAAEKSARLEEIDTERRRDLDRIAAERRERERVHARVAAEVRASRRRIEVLRADEARLSRVVEEIGRVLSARPGAGHSYAEASATPGGASVKFSALRGRLGLPVAGPVAPRSGEASSRRELAEDSPAQSARSSDKGIFIRAGAGQPVKAVASGRVVFADWMRGFGNLLILDHGESYLSVYANAESLLKQVGESVSPGEQIAVVGASGGREESGLYFEIRHMGRPFDPLRWIKRK